MRKSRRGDNNLPRDIYRVLTTCIAVVSTNKPNSLLSLLLGCHEDDTHKSRPNIGAWFKGEKESDLLWHFSMSAPCFHVTKTTKQWRIVEIELLASAGWKCCCQPFSCPCSQNVTRCRKEICSTWWTSKDPIPTRSFRDLLYIQWLCSQLCYLTAANQRTIVGIELLATVGWKFGGQPFSRLRLKNVTRSRKEIYATYGICLRNPFPLFLFGIPSIQPLPEATGSWEQQYDLNYGCIMPMPSMQLKENTCLTRRSRGFGHGAVVSKMCYNTVIVLSVVLCDCCKPTNHCRDWALSRSGLEVWLPAFQLPTFAKCDALPKRDLFDMFV